MYKHSAVDGITCCRSATTAHVDWERFLSPVITTGASVAPLDTFYASQRALIKLASLVNPDSAIADDARDVLSGQIVLGYVSSVELYLRELVSGLVEICPGVRSNSHNEMVRYGAVQYYANSKMGYALTERISFSDASMVRKVLKDRLGVDVDKFPSLRRTLSDFEKVCHLRHSLIHSHGVVNSISVVELTGGVAGGSRKLSFEPQTLQWVASVAVNLVREVAKETLRVTLARWIETTYLCGDGRRDKPKIKQLLAHVGSRVDFANPNEDKLDDIDSIYSRLRLAAKSRAQA